jgi:YidC/Oxa1 family membrane protein insertase
MTNEQRTLIAIVLSLAVLFLYPYLVKRFIAPAPEKAKVETPVAQAPAAPAPVAEKVSPAVRPAAAERPVERITVSTPLYSAVLTDLGAGIEKWELKDYKTSLEKDAPYVDIAKAAALHIKTRVGGARPWRPSKKTIRLEEGAEELVFTTAEEGLDFEKSYNFKSDDYRMEVSLKAANASKVPAKTTVYVDMERIFEADEYYHYGPIRKAEGKVVRQKPDASIEGGGPADWVGLEDKYFISALIPLEKTFSWESVGGEKSRLTAAFPLELKPGESATLKYNLYIGPKEYRRLKGEGLTEAIEFGWFDFLARPFLVVLNFFEQFVKNYGLAIIALTLVVKVVLHPLTKYGLNSMKKIQQLQPQMQAVRERYKNDKEKMNRELLELYKRQSVNPLGGCLPMLVQIPIFIALYEVLYAAIELRHAPFIFWVVDLSAKDPYYILPVLMGGSMFVQQKMTPTTMDPVQEKMMLVLPVVFTFIFLSFPSGLVLYWLTNNVISIAQQYQIYKGARAK